MTPTESVKNKIMVQGHSMLTPQYRVDYVIQHGAIQLFMFNNLQW